MGKAGIATLCYLLCLTAALGGLVDASKAVLWPSPPSSSVRVALEASPSPPAADLFGPTASPSPSPTVWPAPQPTPSATSTPSQAPPPPTPLPMPSASPVLASSPPSQALAQPPPRSCGAPPNPWGYNFCAGGLIQSPPADFCSYFNCIPSFWKQTNGYVIQCADGTFSHSGGVRGSCSSHGGNGKPLFQ